MGTSLPEALAGLWKAHSPRDGSDDSVYCQVGLGAVSQVEGEEDLLREEVVPEVVYLVFSPCKEKTLVSPLGCHRETELCLSELDPGEEAQVAGLDVGSGEGLSVAFFSVQGERTLVM